MPIAVVAMSSEPWKERLDQARHVVAEAALAPPDAPDRRLDFEALLGAYCARRLIEIHAVRGSIVGRRWNLMKFRFDPGRERPKVAFAMKSMVVDAYLWEAPEQVTMTTKAVLNNLVHCAFLLDAREYDDDGFPGPVCAMSFTTDKLRANAAFSIDLEDLLSIFDEVSKACLATDEALEAITRDWPSTS